MKHFKGIIHVHSDFSYDGQHSLKEIAVFAKKRGYHFVGMSEHSDTFNEEKMAEYLKECQKVSSPDCLIIPGIEFTCDQNLHLIGLGVENYIDSKDPFVVARHIHEQNGVTIIAHPSRSDYQLPINLASAVDGIEVWSVAYDGRFVPNNHSLNLIKKMRKENVSIIAFGGQDLHRIMDNCNVEITVSGNGGSRLTILHALKEGHFTVSNFYFRLDSRNELSRLELIQIYLGRQIYTLTKIIRNQLFPKHE